eukprot:TRINITY_DN426_c0_g1::TRINITY_DN426_c0_g1_i1::g.2510::m.2510 TRINITY_DN426_c0_g1::TRINITY_DN426_c0_g1_i1::g.2510  ORF type:complete len:460 (-),score=161.67,FCH/PF00611.18/5.4e-07 TRINITY_DN426_c0_g1_i1:417-1673(-)
MTASMQRFAALEERYAKELKALGTYCYANFSLLTITRPKRSKLKDTPPSSVKGSWAILCEQMTAEAELHEKRAKLLKTEVANKFGNFYKKNNNDFQKKHKLAVSKHETIIQQRQAQPQGGEAVANPQVLEQEFITTILPTLQTSIQTIDKERDDFMNERLRYLSQLLELSNRDIWVTWRTNIERSQGILLPPPILQRQAQPSSKENSEEAKLTLATWLKTGVDRPGIQNETCKVPKPLVVLADFMESNDKSWGAPSLFLDVTDPAHKQEVEKLTQYLAQGHEDLAGFGPITSSQIASNAFLRLIEYTDVIHTNDLPICVFKNATPEDAVRVYRDLLRDPERGVLSYIASILLVTSKNHPEMSLKNYAKIVSLRLLHGRHIPELAGSNRSELDGMIQFTYSLLESVRSGLIDRVEKPKQ